jgi:hypothetical protein
MGQSSPKLILALAGTSSSKGDHHEKAAESKMQKMQWNRMGGTHQTHPMPRVFVVARDLDPVRSQKSKGHVRIK